MNLNHRITGMFHSLPRSPIGNFCYGNLLHVLVLVLVVVSFYLFCGEMSMYLWLSSSVKNSDCTIICEAKSSSLTDGRHGWGLSWDSLGLPSFGISWSHGQFSGPRRAVWWVLAAGLVDLWEIALQTCHYHKGICQQKSSHGVWVGCDDNHHQYNYLSLRRGPKF